MQLEIRELAKVYPANRGLRPLSLSIGQGEFVGIVGHNGAGKSTLLKMLAGWIRPDQGTFLADGVSSSDRQEFVRKVGFVPEAPNLYESFSVEANLKVFARLFGLPATRVPEILKDFDLVSYRRTKVQALSKGLKQRVSLGRSLLADPPILLFDEPTSGLDFEITKEVYGRMKTAHAVGKTILFTSHRPEEVQAFATRILVLHDGGLAFDGLPRDYFQSRAHQDLFQ